MEAYLKRISVRIFYNRMLQNFGFLVGLSSKEYTCSVRTIGDADSIYGMGRSPGEGNDNPTPVFLPGASHGQRSLMGYSPWDGKQMTKAT